METSKCKICRRTGTKLFLRGERCLSAKCAMVKRPYAPGVKVKKFRKTVSEYGKELTEKQKLKNFYHLREKQFSNYVKTILEKKGRVGDASLLLIKKLEHRLDNVIFRLGFALSRAKARQLVSHGHFLVNGRKTDIPSYQTKIGDKIRLRAQSEKKTVFKEGSKKEDLPAWLRYDPEKKEAEVIGEAFVEESALPAEIASVFEFYSK